MRELLRGAPGSRGEATSQVSLQAEAFHQPHAHPLLHRARRHATLRQEPQLGPGTMMGQSRVSLLIFLTCWHCKVTLQCHLLSLKKYMNILHLVTFSSEFNAIPLKSFSCFNTRSGGLCRC